MENSFKTKAEAIRYGEEIKNKRIKSFRNMLVWIERESGKFVVYHNLTGSISNHMGKIQSFV